VVIAILLGAFLRFHKIGEQSIWQDEAYSALCSSQTFADVIKWQVQDSSPPLYYLLLKSWMSMKDMEEGWLRALSAVFGVLFLVSLFLAVKFILDYQTALFALLIATFSPYQIYYSQEARMYSLLSFLSIMIIYSFVRYQKKKDYFSLGLYVLFGVAILYTHNYGIFVVGAGFLLGLFKGPAQRDRRFLQAHLIIFFLFVPWIVAIFAQLSGDTTAWIHKPELKDLIRTLVYFSSRSWYLPLSLSNLPFIFIALFAFVVGLVYALYLAYTKSLSLDSRESEVRNVRTILFFFMIPFLSSFLLSYLKPIYVAGRYDIVFYPAFITLVSYGISKIRIARVKYILLFAIIVSNIIVLNEYFHKFYKSNDRELASYIFKNAKSNPLLVFTDLSSTPFEYYSELNGKEYDYLRYPGGPRGWIEKEAYTRLRTYTEERINNILNAIDSKKGARKRIWVMYEPYPSINRDLLEEIAKRYHLSERVKLNKGELDNQVTDIFIFDLI